MIAPALPRLLIEQTVDLINDPLEVLLVLDSSSVLYDLAQGGAVTLADVVTLAEFDGSPYARQVLADVALQSTSEAVWLEATDPVFADILGGSSNIGAAVVAHQSSGSILEVLTGQGLPSTAIGADKTVRISDGGLVRFELPGVTEYLGNP